MASKFRRGSRWYVSYKDASGCWRKKSLGSEAKADAFLTALGEPPPDLLAQLPVSPPAPDVIAAPVCPFSSAAEDYLAHLAVYGRPASRKHAKISVKHLLGVFGDLDLACLAASAVDHYILHRREAGVANRTINGELIVLRAIINRAAEVQSWTSRRPKIRLLKITRKLPKALTPEEVQTLLSHADHRTRPVLVTALHTGFRCQELIALNWSDIDFQRRTVSVTAKPEIGFSPKAHVERVNPMSDRLCELLREHKRHLAFDRPDDPVFQMKEGHRWTARLITVITEVFKAAGLYNRAHKNGLHQCRRTYATTLLDSGASIEAVRSLGGWASLGIVQTYVTSSDRLKRAAVETLPF